MRGRDGPLRRVPARRGPPRRPPVRLTPLRVVTGLAIAGSLGFLFYGLVRRDRAQIPILSAGLVIFGLTLLATGFWSAVGAYRNARDGRSGAAFAGALFGGGCVLAGSMALTSAVVLALLWESA